MKSRDLLLIIALLTVLSGWWHCDRKRLELTHLSALLSEHRIELGKFKQDPPPTEQQLETLERELADLRSTGAKESATTFLSWFKCRVAQSSHNCKDPEFRVASSTSRRFSGCFPTTVVHLEMTGRFSTLVDCLQHSLGSPPSPWCLTINRISTRRSPESARRGQSSTDGALAITLEVTPYRVP